MPAPKKNQFWKLRSKHGRDKLFTTPDMLWDAACEYFDWCIKNPLYEVDFRGGAAKRVRIPKERPFTLTGLCLYLNCNSKYFNDFEDALKDKPNEDFSEVITRIRETLYTQKFEGAAVGLFNANIIARDLGLKDKTDVTSNDEKLNGPQLLFMSADQLSNEELSAYKSKYLGLDNEL